MNETSYLAAFLIALLGGVHCFGMCGGIVGALTLGLDPNRRGVGSSLPYLLAYNLGRIGSYTVAGALAGGIGAWATQLASVRYGQQFLLLVAGLFMIALGLYLAGWWRGLARLERLGGTFWRRLEPYGRRLLPVRSPMQALGVGLVWGWLPCGLVYSVVVWAIAAGGVLPGALLMLSFGLGTLPALIGMGLFAAGLGSLLRHPYLRTGAGLLVVILGIWQISKVL